VTEVETALVAEPEQITQDGNMHPTIQKRVDAKKPKSSGKREATVAMGLMGQIIAQQQAAATGATAPTSGPAASGSGVAVQPSGRPVKKSRKAR
jgi:hypothetical protein